MGEIREQGLGLVAIGRVLRPWGIKGEVVVEPFSEDRSRFSGGLEVAVERAGSLGWRRLRSAVFKNNRLVVGFEGSVSPEDAESLRGAFLKVASTESPPLPEGSYYHDQILGLNVFTLDGGCLGTLEEIMETGSNDVYVVRGAQGEHLLPAIKHVIISIDLSGRKMVVRPMEMAE